MTDGLGDAKAIVNHDGRRFEIEECIRDVKDARQGLSLEEARTKQVSRWEVLLAATVEAYTIMRRCGEIARDRGLARRFSTSGRPRSHATFLIAVFSIQNPRLRSFDAPSDSRPHRRSQGPREGLRAGRYARDCGRNTVLICGCCRHSTPSARSASAASVYR